ncbi:hypothetical protein AB1Y20_005903 [Prymnesium parvum]|uniref:Transporter n=1 Tax=Prymnesium parvum TaxID=97485 RepID=A0AB34J2J3_PRYPA
MVCSIGFGGFTLKFAPCASPTSPRRCSPPSAFPSPTLPSPTTPIPPNTDSKSFPPLTPRARTAAPPAASVMPEAKRWDSQFTFILASIGSAIGFGNIWRFPMMAYKFGGGAFLLPYLLALCFAAVPIAALEFALGQVFQCDHVQLTRRLCPAAAGLGWAAVLGTFLLVQFYNALLAYVWVYVCFSLASPQPWGAANMTAHSFFMHDVLERTDSIETTGGLVPSLVVSYFVVWATVCVGVCRGAESIGLSSKLLMPLPFLILLLFLIRGCTLPGAGEGLAALITPDFSVLFKADIWAAAVGQILFGVSAGLGTLTSYGAYNDRSTPVVSSAAIVCFANAGFSLLAGVTVFAFLGHMSAVSGVPVLAIVKSGPALAFEVFPTALATLPLPQLWGCLFFLMLQFLGVSSAISMTAPLTMALQHHFARSTPVPGRRRLFAACADFLTATPTRIAIALHAVGFAVGLLYVTRAGFYWLDLADHFVPMFLTICVAIGECILVGWRYGSARLVAALPAVDRKWATFLWWTWKWLNPVVLLLLLLGQTASEFSAAYGDYPGWALLVGWVLSVGPMLLLPCLAMRRSLGFGAGSPDGLALMNAPGASPYKVAAAAFPSVEAEMVQGRGEEELAEGSESSGPPRGASGPSNAPAALSV